MRRILIILTILFNQVFSEADIALAKSQGEALYSGCIITPPNIFTAGGCAADYAAYVATLAVINAPLPIVPTTSPSPYAYSEFDLCKYETSHLVFDNPVTQPYCPATL